MNRMMPNNKLLTPFALTGLLCLVTTIGATAAEQPLLNSAQPPATTEACPPCGAPDASARQRITAEVRHEIARVKPLLDRYGYGGVAVAVGVEGAGIPAPGQTLMIAAAVDAASAHAKLNIGWLLLTAFLAAAIGNSLGYLIGRRGGRTLLQRLPVDARHLQRVETAFDRWGGWLIAGARFFDGLRQLNGIAAGMLRMPWWRFTWFNLLGAALWVGVWGLGFYYLEEHLHQVLAAFRHLNPWMVAGTCIGLALLIAFLWPRAGRAAPGAEQQ